MLFKLTEYRDSALDCRCWTGVFVVVSLVTSKALRITRYLRWKGVLEASSCRGGDQLTLQPCRQSEPIRPKRAVYRFQQIFCLSCRAGTLVETWLRWRASLCLIEPAPTAVDRGSTANARDFQSSEQGCRGLGKICEACRACFALSEPPELSKHTASARDISPRFANSCHSRFSASI